MHSPGDRIRARKVLDEMHDQRYALASWTFEAADVRQSHPTVSVSSRIKMVWRLSVFSFLYKMFERWTFVSFYLIYNHTGFTPPVPSKKNVCVSKISCRTARSE